MDQKGKEISPSITFIENLQMAENLKIHLNFKEKLFSFPPAVYSKKRLEKLFKSYEVSFIFIILKNIIISCITTMFV